ncbi:TlpA disulfide reductase family protein [Catenulispora subtropica]|uniref:Thioredoxin domain-containing protein n=1 Tax=Catenulispora subtropica TaxID=450798 RepID=A0ABP5CJB4_9ACTN
MSYLAAAVGLLTLLTLFNLILMLGVIRRLREHSERLGSLSGAGVPVPAGPMMPVGETVGAFTTATTDGETVSSELFDGETLVGFFSPGCQPCKVQLPRFAAHARSFPGGRDRVLAVVVVGGPDEDPEPYVKALAGVARVVVEPHGGPLYDAFEVTGFPSVALVDSSGTVQATSARVGDLSAARPQAVGG